MHYEITEVSHVTGSPHYYVLVRFWLTEADRLAGQQPVLVEDFVMHLDPVGVRAILDRQGQPTGQTETFTVDVRAELVANIERYIARAKAKTYRGDRSQAAAFARDTADPKQVLTRADVQALPGTRGTR